MRSELITRLLLAGLLAALVGLAVRPYAASRALEQAQRSKANAQPVRAAGFLAEAAERLPAYPGLWEQAGQAALQGGDFQAALSYLKRAGLEGLSPGGLAALGDAFLQAGDPWAALQTWQALPNADPAILRRRYTAHRLLEDYPAAIADLQALAALQPGEAAQLSYQLGLLLAATRPAEAVQPLEDAALNEPALQAKTEALRRSLPAAGETPDPAYALLSAGRGLASLDEWALAVEAFRRAVQARPDYAEAWAYLGEARQHLPSTRPADGYNDLQTALRLDPASLPAHTFLALYWNRQGRHDLAEAAIRRAVELQPHSPALYASLGDILAALGRPPAALEAYQQASKLAPNDPAYLRLLAIFALENDYALRQAALPAARRLAWLLPQSADSQLLLGRTLLKLNDLANAERHLLDAAGLEPHNAAVRLYLGELYRRQGLSERACAELHQAYALDRDGPVGEQAARLLPTCQP